MATTTSVSSSSSSSTGSTAALNPPPVTVLSQHVNSPSPRRLASPLPLGLSTGHRNLGRSGSASNLSINFSPNRPIVRSYPASPTAHSSSSFSSSSSSFPPHSSRARDTIHAPLSGAPSAGFNLRSAYSWSIPRHLDFELAMSQLRRLLVNPKSVYQDVYFHKQTKNQWHRDDPAFTLSLAGLITLSSLLWGIFYYQFTFPRLLGLTLRMLLVDYLIVGFSVACIAYLLANRTIMASSSRYTTGHAVSLLYAWDVHLNAYVPYVMVAHGVQLMVAWMVTSAAGHALTARVVGNAVYGLAWVLYVLYTYWGYRALPFLMHPEYVLYLLAVLAIVWLAALSAGVNFSIMFLNLYS